MSKLLLIGAGSVHTYNYYKLIEDYFDDILLLTDEIRNDYSNVKCVKGNFTLKNPIKAFEKSGNSPCT